MNWLAFGILLLAVTVWMVVAEAFELPRWASYLVAGAIGFGLSMMGFSVRR